MAKHLHLWFHLWNIGTSKTVGNSFPHREYPHQLHTCRSPALVKSACLLWHKFHSPRRCAWIDSGKRTVYRNSTRFSSFQLCSASFRNFCFLRASLGVLLVSDWPSPFHSYNSCWCLSIFVKFRNNLTIRSRQPLLRPPTDRFSKVLCSINVF